MVPESSSVVTVRVQEGATGGQALEGEIDSAHAAILHSPPQRQHDRAVAAGQDLSPKFEVQPHVPASASRRGADGTEHNLRCGSTSS